MRSAPHFLPPPEALIARIRSALGGCMAIYMFGSQAQGTPHAQSDLDLAVLVAGYAAPLDLWRLSSDLEAIAGCPVDLLDLRAANTVMQYQVITTGQRLWAEGMQSDMFETFVMSEKLALDTARAPLLQDIQQRGSVYGG